MSVTKEQFISYLKNNNLKWSRQRDHLMDIFLSAEGHLTADELFKQAQQKYPQIGYATVYRTLKLLANCGIATAARFGHKSARFEMSRTDRHHDHLVCTECGGIIEFKSDQIENMQETVARKKGFTITHHKLFLYGICKSCNKDRQ
jgi:Fur family ferric uptake transcriptional regulator